ncbi:MAG: hydantoinase B/oxoprolinase family protein [Armatimonadaceae bacterium]
MQDTDSINWQVWVDTGGTFTDCLAIAPDGGWHRVKVLSSSALRGTVRERLSDRELRVQEAWNAATDFVRGFTFAVLGSAGSEVRVSGYDPGTRLLTLESSLSQPVETGTAFEVRSPFEAPILAARLVTQTPPDQPLPPLALRLATTRGTNALLTRSGIAPAFFVTKGFADLLHIGTQQRPDLFARDIRKPEPLTGAVIEVSERLAADGSILIPLNDDAIRKVAAELVSQGITTAAVALLHAATNPMHEQRVGAFLYEAGFTHISLSAERAPFVKILPRAETAVVNAYLAPVIDAYVERVAAEVRSGTLHLMTSAGGLVSPSAFQPKDSLLSGPAGGIVGAALSGKAAGYDRVIAFDMGGTSTDVARFDRDFEYTFEHSVGDAHLLAPALAIESVAAGGGSLCTSDRQGLRVGPESAGAFPGPACYGAGGPLTITDVNLLLGRLLPDRFEIPLSHEAAKTAAEDSRLDDDALLEGLLEIANERMADAIRKISVRRGYDPSEYALVSFGGAGGQHACAVAARLGIRTVIVPRDASLLSAWGIGQATIERFAERQVLKTLNDFDDSAIATLMDELTWEAENELRAEGVHAERITVRRQIVNLRLLGQETALSVEWNRKTPLHELFADRYEAVYGHRPGGERAVEVESVRVVAAEKGQERREPQASSQPALSSNLIPVSTVRARFNGIWQDTPVYTREMISPETEIAGPALIAEPHSVVVVEPGWRITALSDSGALVLRTDPETDQQVTATRPAPEAVTEELFASRFAGIAEEMGEMLQRTALSVNVKERLDFSCALLGPEGDLIASAAHIPVHLGALGVCVRRLRETIPMTPGDTVVVNHPAFGGSHLPDVTVVTPVYTDSGTLLGYVANRAHHAEIGGKRPGSMPPDARTLAEEGVVLPPTLLVQGGVSRLDEVCRLLTEYPYPTRAVADNRADLEAALAANRRGASALRDLAEAAGDEMLRQQMARLTARAEQLLCQSLAQIPDGTYTATELLDDGNPITVTVTIAGEAAEIDFAGTAPVHPGNLNAPPAVVASAALYVLRLLVGEPLPLNEGLLRPVTLRLPEDSLVNPRFDLNDPAQCPAVVGGNVETSQRIVGTLLKALGLMASSQGTMNNVLFGNDRFGYYETVCGGAGATADAPGASAVHTHMTNTRITDAELLERRYPVRLERFAIRKGSGGTGKHPGGNGVVREFSFLAPMELSLLTQHRVRGPFGMAGGEPGQPGRQTLLRANGETQELPPVGGASVEPGDRLILETPGGGGWGEA